MQAFDKCQVGYERYAVCSRTSPLYLLLIMHVNIIKEIYIVLRGPSANAVDSVEEENKAINREIYQSFCLDE